MDWKKGWLTSGAFAALCGTTKEKPAGNYLYLCCRGRWDISAGHAALNRCILERGWKRQEISTPAIWPVLSSTRWRKTRHP